VDAGGAFSRLYTSTAGTITISQIGEATNSVIRGHVDNVTLVETDGVALVAGGCATTLPSLGWALTQGAVALQATSHAHNIVANIRARRR
jgi:hypothetical protein